MTNPLKRLICWLRGHDYPTSVFDANTLYFCRRCRREMLGRSFEDIAPRREDEQYLMDLINAGTPRNDTGGLNGHHGNSNVIKFPRRRRQFGTTPWPSHPDASA